MSISASGVISFYSPRDIINEELDSDLNIQRIQSSFNFEPNYDVPNIAVSDGEVIIKKENKMYGLLPDKVTLSLSENITNHIFLGLLGTEIKFHVDAVDEPPHFPSVKIGTVDTSQDIATAYRDEIIGYRLPRYRESELPVPRHKGRMIWNEDRKVISYDDGEDWEVPVIGDNISIESTVVENTTDEIPVWEGNLDRGSMRKRKVYEISLFGKFSNASPQDKATFNYYLEDKPIASVTSIGQNVNDDPWRIKLIFTVVSEGQNGTLQPHSIAKFNQDNIDSFHGSIDLNTNGVSKAEAKVQWNNAKTGNVITIAQGYMKEVS